MTRADKFLLVGILLASLISGTALYSRFFLGSVGAEPVQAVITVSGKAFRTLALQPGASSSFVVQGRRGASKVEVDGMRVRMQQAPCENGICLKQGWIEHPGQSVVCVPGEIVIRLEGAAPLDAVTR
jgi:hypothetical protein